MLELSQEVGRGELAHWSGHCEGDEGDVAPQRTAACSGTAGRMMEKGEVVRSGDGEKAVIVIFLAR